MRQINDQTTARNNPEPMRPDITLNNGKKITHVRTPHNGGQRVVGYMNDAEWSEYLEKLDQTQWARDFDNANK
jgi:hypothetical protein